MCVSAKFECMYIKRQKPKIKYILKLELLGPLKIRRLGSLNRGTAKQGSDEASRSLKNLLVPNHPRKKILPYSRRQWIELLLVFAKIVLNYWFLYNYITCPDRVDFPASTWPINVMLTDSLRFLSNSTGGFLISVTFNEELIFFVTLVVSSMFFSLKYKL